MYAKLMLGCLCVLLVVQIGKGIRFRAEDDDDVIDFATRIDADTDPTQNVIPDAEIIDTLKDESDSESYCEWLQCDKDLRQPQGIRKIIDFPFLRKVVRNLNPFSKPRQHMHFYLFTREFPECGRELNINDEQELQKSGFNASLGTRILIHGWMSQSLGSFNRDVKNAYLNQSDVNVIVADWSASASNINYFSVVKLIEEFGAQLAQFTRSLNKVLNADFDKIYLIGHSLGAQIAGSAGKQIKPDKYNTIFALDPAGPKFRKRSAEFRIDPSDAKYVESIQTSSNLGFLTPTGDATFYPNFGVYQQKCYYVGCSHIRAYKMFAESINSKLGFWGTPCERDGKYWGCDESRRDTSQMGGDPSRHKRGVFYVKTGGDEPFALGRNL